MRLVQVRRGRETSDTTRSGRLLIAIRRPTLRLIWARLEYSLLHFVFSLRRPGHHPEILSLIVSLHLYVYYL